MTGRRRGAVVLFLAVMALPSSRALAQTAATAQAQSTPPQATPQSTQSGRTDADMRPATTTFFGDTGIWFVPTAEVLSHGQWSASAYRRGSNYIQGYTNVADFAGTFAVGIKDRAEIFGSFLVDSRIDRDLRPLFAADPTIGGVADRYPLVNQYWTGDNIGDLYLGAKVNLWSEYRKNPAAIAVRGIVKVPTGKKSAGVSTGKTDFLVDMIASKEVARAVEVSGFAGYEFRGSADGFDAPTGAFRWGAGTAFPSRSRFRGSAEINGVLPSADSVSITSAALAGIDGSRPPTVSNTENITRATLGVTYQAGKGFFVGTGLSWNVPTQSRLTGQSENGETPFGDYWDWQFRIGYHPGVRVYVAPPPPLPAPPPPMPPPMAEHRLTVKAECNPCTIEVLKSSTVTATAQDSIMCGLTYRWSASTGTFANPSTVQTVWTAPDQEGTVPVTVTATCPTDNKTASASVNILVTRPAVKTYTFDDVYFDFDRYSLRPEATRVLDEAVAAMQADALLKLRIEGHTCNIGTAEYNLALGNRRANAVKNYLSSRGIAADRLTMVSYGEEMPKFDNAKEETRRLNRRAALVVNLQH